MIRTGGFVGPNTGNEGPDLGQARGTTADVANTIVPIGEDRDLVDTKTVSVTPGYTTTHSQSDDQVRDRGC
jgi:hypothetical protein